MESRQPGLADSAETGYQLWRGLALRFPGVVPELSPVVPGGATLVSFARVQMKPLVFLACLVSIAPFAQGNDLVSEIVVDRRAFSEVYPAVWFSPSTGEIQPLKERSEFPPGGKYEIWIEPRDPEFCWAPGGEPAEVGFMLLGKGEEVFANPSIPEEPTLNRKLTDLLKESEGPEKCVFYCRAGASECVIMITALDRREQVISFQWKLLASQVRPGTKQ